MTNAEASARRVESRRRARVRRCAFVAILAASVHLAFQLEPMTALAQGALAALLSTVMMRFGVGTRVDAARAAGHSARQVLSVTVAPLLVAPVWIAMLDPTRGMAEAPWRSILLSAFVCAGVAALVVRLWIRFESEVEASGGEKLVGLRATLVGLVAGPWLLFGDALARGFEQDWSALHFGLAISVFAAAAALLAGSIVHRMTRELARPLTRLVDPLAEEAAPTTPVADRLSGLEAEVDQARDLLQALGLERDRQVVELAHANDVARGVAPALEAGREAQTELAARLASARPMVSRLRTTRDAIEGHADALAVHLESTAQQLVTAEQTGRRRIVAATHLLVASRDTASGLTDLGRSMRTLEPATDAITELSLDVVARVELGRARLAETVAGMEAIRAATQSAESVIRGLAVRTREIGGILDVIDDVGDQTSLLALNAAIIAAQAGEHGRAFSVVAEEIRDLADRVLVGTKEVGGLIRAVQAESEQAIAAIEAGSAAVLQGVERSVDTGKAFDEITTVARDSGERIAGVVETVRQQTRSLERVESVAARIEAAARELAETNGVRPEGPLDAERLTHDGRAHLEDLRTAVRDQTGELLRIESELRLADDRGRAAGAALESGFSAAEAVGRVIAGGRERVQSLASAIERLVENQRDLSDQVEALRGVGSKPAPASHRAEPALRATGEPS